MRYEWGQTSERTQKVKALIDEVSELVLEDEFGVQEAKELLGAMARDFPDDEEVFVAALRSLLEEAVDDGQIDDRERKLITDLALVIENPISDDPVERMDGTRIVLTGDFAVEGGKATVKKMIQAAGGRVTTGKPSRLTDYVVVGSEGSSAWAFGNYGNKVKDALNLQLTGKGKVKVVTEKALLAFFEESEQKAMDVLELQRGRFQEQWDSARVVAKDFEGLTEGQQRVFDLVKEGRNVYLTGLGGTGKSYVLERIIEWAEGSGREVLVCAPTGIAALNVGGSTIHRTLGINPNRTLQMDPYPYIPDDSPLLKCDLMIVDEISMCRLDLFDYLTSVLRKAARSREDEGKPCCQLVVVGDFCQLPPVTTPEESPILKEKYGFDVRKGYPFMGREWQSWQFEKVELTVAIRQRDEDFVAALNACRIGDTKGVRWIEEHAAKSPGKNAIILCGTNDQADGENRKRLNALPSKARVYLSDITGEVTQKDMPTAQRLTLKQGARVMALVNVSESAYMNGSLGTVVSCKNDEVVVDFDGIGTSAVTRHRWEVTVPKLVDGKTKQEIIGTFEQIPLKLAWAITIHKSQGQTFESALIYPKCWEEGQLYTAFSRLSSIAGLCLAHPCSDSFLVTSQDVIDFLEGDYHPPKARELPKRDVQKVAIEEPRASVIQPAPTMQNSSEVERSDASGGAEEQSDSFKGLQMPVICGRRVFEKHGVTRVEDLVGLTQEDLARMRGLGPTKLENLRSFLRGKGIMPQDSDFPLSISDYESWIDSIK